MKKQQQIGESLFLCNLQPKYELSMADNWDHRHLADLKLKMELQYFKTNVIVARSVFMYNQWLCGGRGTS